MIKKLRVLWKNGRVTEISSEQITDLLNNDWEIISSQTDLFDNRYDILTFKKEENDGRQTKTNQAKSF